MRDSYGKIKVLVQVDRMDNVILTPVSERRRQEVSRSNLYDGSYDVYLQDQGSIDWFCENYPQATFISWGGARYVNDGAVILMDSWDYRHLVGGQTD